jgi:hypothetical protein
LAAIKRNLRKGDQAKKAKGIADAVVTPVKRPVVVALSSTPYEFLP